MAAEMTPPVQTTTAAQHNQNGQVYTCSSCNRNGGPSRMDHVQKYGDPSVSTDGKIQNVVCHPCGDDLRVWAGTRGHDYWVHNLLGTLRILAANARDRAEKLAAAEAERRANANAFAQALTNPTVQGGNGQAVAKDRRRVEQSARAQEREGWDQVRDRAVNGHHNNGVFV